MVEVMKIMATSFKRSRVHTASLSAPTLQQATTDPWLRRRLLDTRRQVCVSLLLGHCFFLLGPGAHETQESVSLVLCKFVCSVALCGG